MVDNATNLEIYKLLVEDVRESLRPHRGEAQGPGGT